MSKSFNASLLPLYIVGVALGGLGIFSYLIGLRQLVGLSWLGFAFLGTACLAQGAECLSNYLANSSSSQEEIPNAEILKIMARLDEECGITDPDSRTVVPQSPWDDVACTTCGVLVPRNSLRNGLCGSCKMVRTKKKWDTSKIILKPREIYETDVPTMATPQVQCPMCANRFWTVREMGYHQWTTVHRYSMSVKELQKWKKRYPSPFPTPEQE